MHKNWKYGFTENAIMGYSINTTTTDYVKLGVYQSLDLKIIVILLIENSAIVKH